MGQDKTIAARPAPRRGGARIAAILVAAFLVAAPAAQAGGGNGPPDGPPGGPPEHAPGPPEHAPGPPAGDDEGTFTALNYNVAGLTEYSVAGQTVGISGSNPSRNSALISPLLNAYDLVLLQEDWEDHFDQQGIERPPGVPPSFFHHEIVSEVDHPYRSDPAHHPYGTDLRRTPPSGPPLISDGLNRLSRFPFDEVERRMWRTCHGEFTVEVVEAILDPVLDGLEDAGFGRPLEELGVTGQEGLVDGGASDCSAQKGFSLARMELAPGVEVDVYNLHGEAGSHVNDVAARADNFAQLAEFINAQSQGRAVIVAGDMNLEIASDDPLRGPEDQETWDDFQEATGVIDVCAAIDCGPDGTRIEKFAFRDGGGVDLTPTDFTFERERFTRSDGEPLSDHPPLVVTFRWESS